MGEAKAKRRHLLHVQDAALLAISENDARFFLQNAGRLYHLRPAMPEEVAFNAAHAGALPLDPDCILYVGVRQLRPGVHERRFAQAVPGFDCASATDAYIGRKFGEMGCAPAVCIDVTPIGAGRESVH